MIPTNASIVVVGWFEILPSDPIEPFFPATLWKFMCCFTLVCYNRRQPVKWLRSPVSITSVAAANNGTEVNHYMSGKKTALTYYGVCFGTPVWPLGWRHVTRDVICKASISPRSHIKSTILLQILQASACLCCLLYKSFLNNLRNTLDLLFIYFKCEMLPIYSRTTRRRSRTTLHCENPWCSRSATDVQTLVGQTLSSFSVSRAPLHWQQADLFTAGCL